MRTPRDESALPTRLAQQETLADLTQRALEADDLDEIFAAASSAVLEGLEADCCRLFEPLPTGDQAVCRWNESADDWSAPTTVPATVDASPVGLALADGESARVADLRTDDRFDEAERLRDRGVRSSLCVPAGPSDETRAILAAHATAPDAFDDADATFLRTVATVLASELEDERAGVLAGVDDGRLLEAAPAGLVAVDVDGTVQFANRRAADVLGRPRDEIVAGVPGDSAWTLTDTRGTPIAAETFADIVEQGEPIDGVEIGLRRPDGTQLWLSVSGRPLRSNGDLAGAVFSLREVSERRAREHELEQYRALTEAARDVIVTIDEESTIRSVNPAVEDVFGYDRDDLVGESLATLIPDRLEDDHDRALERYLETGERTLDWEYVELPGLCADGSEIPLAVSFAEVEYDGERYFTGIVRDVTERAERQRQLREERDLTDRIVETSPTGIITLGPDGSFERVNERAEEIMGYSPAELERRVGDATGLDPVKPDGEPFSADEIPTRRVFRDGETIHDLEIGLERADGARVWLSLSGTPMREDGEITGAVFTFVDITERVRVEADLRASEAKFRQVAENLEQVVWLSTPEKREMLYVNPAYEEVWGRSIDSLYERPQSFLEGIHPDDRERVRDAVSDQPEGTYDEEYRVVRPDGEVRWVRDRAVPITDRNGDVSRIVGIASDITDRRSVERELRERERELSTLMSNVPGMVYRCRNERGWPMEFVSEGSKELAGYDPGAIERDEIRWGTDVVVEEDRGDLWEHVQETVTDGEPFSTTYRIETAAGDRRWVKETGRAIFEDGEIEAIEGVIIDITERKAYQQELEEANALLERANARLEESNRRLETSNERLEQFAYAASHDLQEPLRMVSSYLRLIERRYGDAFDEDGEEFLAFAVDGAERMREMIDGLLAYSRVEAQGDPLEPVDLNAVVDDALADLQLRLEESDAEVTVEDLPRVEGDPSQLRQVFQNLLDNAITYAGDEPPRIHVGAKRRGREWVISVADEGIGMEPAKAETIFEVFERLHTVDEHPGTGIGLALCQRILERHGTEIDVETAPGEGATFSFALSPAIDERD